MLQIAIVISTTQQLCLEFWISKAAKNMEFYYENLTP